MADTWIQSTWAKRGRVVVVVAAVIVGLGITIQRPWLTQWGSTKAERTAPLPGDDVVRNKADDFTRAITIDAPPERVWPWIVQMGEDRGGFYNYDWGEQLFGDPVHNAIRIVPKWQQLNVGDKVRPYPFGTPWVVGALAPNRLLVLELKDRSWSWGTLLEPLPGGRTRVVTSFHSAPAHGVAVVVRPVMRAADLILFPRLLTGIKQRAEGTLPGMPGTHTGQPFPIARLPVHWWAALVWLAGLAALALALGPALRPGDWGLSRPHPVWTVVLAGLAGAGYAVMSDTPPVQFLTHTWGLGTALAVVGGFGLAAWVSPRREPAARPLGSVFGRAVVALAEAGMWLVLPATAVWQGATARGWTTSVAAHAGVGLAATLAAIGVWALATEAWRGGAAALRVTVLPAALLTLAYAVTGSGIVLLGGIALVDLLTRPAPPPIIDLDAQRAAARPRVRLDRELTRPSALS